MGPGLFPPVPNPGPDSAMQSTCLLRPQTELILGQSLCSCFSILPRTLLPPVFAGAALTFRSPAEEDPVVEVPLTPRCRGWSQLHFRGASDFVAESALPPLAPSRPLPSHMCSLSPGESSSLLTVSEPTWGLQVPWQVCAQVPAASWVLRGALPSASLQ